MAELLTPKIYNIDRYILSTVIHKPEGKGPFPAVILIPGFTGYKDEEHMVRAAEDLAEAGILAVRFDTVGRGQSEGTIEEDYRVSNYMNDIDYIYTYLTHQDYVQHGAIGLCGHSMGGMLAIVYAVQNPEIKAVCSISASTKFGESPWLKGLMKEWETNGSITVESTKYGKMVIPYAFYKDAGSYSGLESAKELKQPILVLLGDADTIVLPEITQELAKAISSEKKIVEIPGMGHDYKKYPELVKQVNKEIILFFKQSLTAK